MKSLAIVLFLGLVLSACVMNEAQWEAHYRATCEKRAVQPWEDRKPTEAEIQHCIELERSGISADNKLHDSEGDVFDIFRH